MLNESNRDVIKAVLGEENYNFLVDLANEINTQDNRCTAKPILFQLEERYWMYGVDPAYHDAETVVVDSGAELEIEFNEGFIEQMTEILELAYDDGKLEHKPEVYLEMSDEELDACAEDEIDLSSVFQLIQIMKSYDPEDPWNSMSIDDVTKDALDELGYDATIVHRTKISRFNGNTFLTERAYDEHIKRNGHNLRQPRSYVTHAYRNNEIEQLLLIVGEFATKPEVSR